MTVALNNCPKCGVELPPHAPEGLCPRCLLEQGLKETHIPPDPDATVRCPKPALTAEMPVINGYSAVREIARSGQAVVYEAVQLATTKKVAIKVVHGGPFIGPKALARFEREVQILAALNHPNIVQVIDRGKTADGSHFLVMPYISGRSLDQWLHAYYQKHPDGPPPDDPSELLRLSLKICDAVNAAHLRGVVHRDLKPSNIRIDEDGEPHVLDFGLARTAVPAMTDEDQPQPVTITGQFLGSLPWAAPEQAEGAISKIDMRTDVYALGVILYQMLTGKFPYEVVGNMADVLNNIRNALPAPPSTVGISNQARKAYRHRRWLRRHRRPINDILDAIILKALAKRREDRYQAATELARDLTAYLSGRPTVVAAKAHTKPTRIGVIVLLGSMAATTACLITWYLARAPSRTEPISADAQRTGAEERSSAVAPLTTEERQRVRGNLKSALTRLGLKPDEVATKMYEVERGRLSLSGTSISELSPLRGLPLKELRLDGLKISDISPLGGMPLYGLSLANTSVADLGPLQGMPIDVLGLDNTRVTDLAPLKGMPLRS